MITLRVLFRWAWNLKAISNLIENWLEITTSLSLLFLSWSHTSCLLSLVASNGLKFRSDEFPNSSFILPNFRKLSRTLSKDFTRIWKQRLRSWPLEMRKRMRLSLCLMPLVPTKWLIDLSCCIIIKAARVVHQMTVNGSDNVQFLNYTVSQRKVTINRLPPTFFESDLLWFGFVHVMCLVCSDLYKTRWTQTTNLPTNHRKFPMVGSSADIKEFKERIEIFLIALRVVCTLTLEWPDWSFKTRN